MKKALSLILMLVMVFSALVPSMVLAADEIDASSHVNVAAGKSYTTTAIYTTNGVQNWPDEGGVTLTDGAKAAADAGFDDPVWVGFNKQSADYDSSENGYGATTVIDLGASTELSKIAFQAFGGAAGISVPYWINLYVSDDGETYTFAKYLEINPDNAVAGVNAYELDIDVTARFVKVCFYGYGWIFIDEIEIYGEDVDAPAEPEVQKTYENTLVKGDNGNYSCEVPYGYTWNINYIDGKIVGEDNTICTTQDAYNACNPNWAITIYAELQEDGTYVALKDAIVTPGSAANAGITLGENQIAIVAHSSASNPDAGYANWMGKIVAVSVKAGDVFVVDMDAMTVYAVIPGEEIVVPEPEHKHTLVHVEAVAPGCHYTGNVEHWYCTECETVWADEALTQVTNHKNVIIPAVGSNLLVHMDAVEPGCHYEGNTEYWICYECEQVWADEALTQLTNIKNVTRPALGGETVHVEAKDPTYTELGNIEHWYCEECGQVWADEALTQVTNRFNVILPMLIHSVTVNVNDLPILTDGKTGFDGNWGAVGTKDVHLITNSMCKETGMEVVILYDLGEVKGIDSVALHFYHCASVMIGYPEGAIILEYSVDGENYETLGYYDLEAADLANGKYGTVVTTCKFDAVKAAYIRATVYAGSSVETIGNENGEVADGKIFWEFISLAEVEITEAHVHELVHMEAVDAGCHYDGNIEHWYCTECETVWADEALTQVTNHKSVIIPALGGDVVHMDAVAPGCHYEGNIEYWICYECEQVWQDEALTQLTNIKNVVLPELGGEVVHVEAVEPTYTELGNIEYWYCEECEQVWADEARTQLTNRMNVILPMLEREAPEEALKIDISHVNAYSWGAYNEMIIFGEGENSTSMIAQGCQWWLAFKVENINGVYTVTEIEGNGEVKDMVAPADGFILYCYSNDAASYEAASKLTVGATLYKANFDWTQKAASETAIGQLYFMPVNYGENVAIGKPVQNADKRPSYNAELTDGVAIGNLTYNAADWFGFYWNPGMDLEGNLKQETNALNGLALPTVDLGGLYNITSVRLNLFTGNTSGICAPESVTLKVSVDGETYETIEVVTFEWPESGVSKVQWVDFILPETVKAQYVRLEMVMRTTFVFINEIEVYGEEAPHEHNIVHIDAVEPGCHYTGNVEHWYCTGCETVWADEALTQITNHKNVIVPELGGEVVHVEAVANGCGVEGNIEYWYCEECEQVWQDEARTQLTNFKNVILPALDHEIVHMEAVAAGCHYTGNTEHWYCTNCETVWADEALTQITNHKNVIVPELGGEVVHVEAVANGCGVEGNIEYWYCEECEQVWQDEARTQLTNFKNVILPALDHEIVHMEAVAAGCHYTGNTEHWYCTNCETVWADEALTQITNHMNVIVPAVGGEVVHVEAVAPTYTELGNIEYWYCEECEQVWQDEALTQLTNFKNVILPMLPPPNLAAGKEWYGDTDVGTSYVGDLTDGVIDPNGEYNTSIWYGADNRKATDGVFTMIIDLGALCDIDETNIHVWPAGYSGIMIPGSIDFYVSVDGENFVLVESITEYDGTDPQWVGTSADVVARYVRIDMTNGTGGVFWFASEIEIYGLEHAHDIVHMEAVAPGCHYTGNVEHWYCTGCETVWADEALTQITNHKNVIVPELGGEVVHVEAVANGCGVEGNIEYWYCEECEQVWQDEARTQLTNFKNVILPALEHELVHMEAVDAGCHYDGNIEHWYCTNCETVWADEALTQITNHKNVIIPALGGDVVHMEAVAPGCHYEGNIEYWICYECEQVWQDEALTQLTNYKNVVLPELGGEIIHVEAVANGCGVEGNIEYWYCEECGQVWADEARTQLTNIKNVVLPALEHELVHMEAVAAGCHYDGNIEHWYCTNCETVWADEALTQITNHKNVIIPALGGDVVHMEAVAPGCHYEGNIEYWICYECEQVWQDEALTQLTNYKNVVLPELGGEVVHMDAVAPGCHYEGNIEYWICYECEQVWADEALTQLTNYKNVVLPALGGEIIHVEAVAPSCGAEGNIEYWYCEECEQVWQDEARTQLTNFKNVILPALEHEYDENGECVNCDDKTDLHVSVSTDKEVYKAGDTITVEILLDRNNGFAHLSLDVLFDTNVLELVGVTNGAIIENFANGLHYVWSAAENATESGVLVTLTFKVVRGATAGSYEIKVVCNEAWNSDELPVSISLSGTSVEIEEAAFIYGDVNGDGKVNGTDVTRLLRFIANRDPFTGESSVEVFEGADVNGDGKVNGTDVTRLLRYIANRDPFTGESSVVLGPAQ